MNLAWKIGYAVLGAVLVTGTLMTGTFGLPRQDREIYNMAVGIDEHMQELGFDDFSLADYKIRFYNGNCDYVVRGGAVSREKAQLTAFAGTTMKVDGEYQVIVPVYGQFRELFAMLDAAQNMSEGTIAFGESEYDGNSHAATIWHEAFHAWQYSNWEMAIDAYLSDDATHDRETVIVQEVDALPTLRESFEEQMMLLEHAYEVEDAEVKAEDIRKVLALGNVRKEQLTKEVANMEYFLVNLEGSAQYIESMAYRRLAGERAWKKQYLSVFSYSGGSGKYYRMGMLKCLILDQVSPGWQSEFNFLEGLDTLLLQAVESR